MQRIIKKLKEDSDYQGFFLKALHDFNKKFNTKGVSDMTDSQKATFFTFVDKNYKGKTEAINEATDVKGVVEISFQASVPGADPDFVKNHIANYLETILSREKKYQFKVVKGLGGAPNVKLT
jgi:hypothetical protein